jgi:DNA invertase Pin-like site-specific DNA recombinase
MSESSSKVTADHLRRDAYLYVRQSTLYQVANNTESARRQYDLRGRAVALGWPAEKVTVIDIDQGQSGASAADREGFQRLVAEVSLGRAGIVLGWNAHGWPATTPTGTRCFDCARSTTR